MWSLHCEWPVIWLWPWTGLWHWLQSSLFWWCFEGFATNFPQLLFRYIVLLCCASPGFLPLCMTFLPLWQSWCHRMVGSVQSLAVQFILPTKIKSDLSLWLKHWNDCSTPPHVRFCQVCWRVGNLRLMDGTDSREMIMSYAPRVDSLEHTCQYPLSIWVR